jgi:predicted PurR-regulated permease PerM
MEGPTATPGTPTETERVMRGAFYVSVVLIVWLMWKVLQPFVLEIGWAVVLAICLDPLRNRLASRLGPTRAALVIVFGVLFLVVAPTIFVGYTLYQEGAVGVDYVHRKLLDEGGPASLFHRAWGWARERVPGLPDERSVLSGVSSRVGGLLELVASRAGSILASLVGFLLSLVIMLSILFFLVRDAPHFTRTLRRVMPFEPEKNEHFVAITSELVSASVTSTIAIAAIQGVIAGLVLVLLGVPGAVLWGVMTTILAFLPLVGGALVWAPISFWLALSGHLGKAIVLALVGLLVLGNVDNVVRPLLLSGKSKLNTLLLIISLMGGVSAFGFIGIVLGPLVAVLATAIIDSYFARPADHPGAPLPAVPVRETGSGAAPTPDPRGHA